MKKVKQKLSGEEETAKTTETPKLEAETSLTAELIQHKIILLGTRK